MTDNIAVKVQMEILCPYCGLLVQQGKTVKSGESFVTHETPMCPKFEKMEAADFLSVCANQTVN